MFGNRSRGDNLSVISNELHMMYEPYGCMLISIYGEGIFWIPKTSSLIRMADELGNQSPGLNGLHDLQIIILLRE